MALGGYSRSEWVAGRRSNSRRQPEESYRLLGGGVLGMVCIMVWAVAEDRPP